jgi:hypothetical protein
MLDVVIDAEGTAVQALTDFAAAAESAGWQPHEEPGPMRGGFVPRTDGEAQSFERGDVVLRVVAMQRDERSVDIRIHGNTEEIPRSRHRPRGIPEAGQQLPRLAAPQGVRLAPRGGSGGQDHYQQNATTDGGLTVADLQNHFSGHLEAAGWSLLHRGGDDRAAWTTWRLPDDQWLGLLLVLNPSGGPRSSLLVRVEAADEGRAGGSGFGIVSSTR